MGYGKNIANGSEIQPILKLLQTAPYSAKTIAAHALHGTTKKELTPRTLRFTLIIGQKNIIEEANGK